MAKKQKVLAVVAHPDDEVLGCGGTLARLAIEGYEIYSLILGDGVTSRDKKRNRKIREKDIAALKTCARRADKILGIKKVFFYDFPDNRFDTAAFLDIVKSVETVKNEIKPNIIFTHYVKDLNIDHQIVLKAVITSTRPLEKESVREIYSFELPSSTEWHYPLSFSPDVFFDITKTMKTKIDAVKEYKNELRDFPHPRSLKGITANAENWGMKVGLKQAEAFKCIRVIK